MRLNKIVLLPLIIFTLGIALWSNKSFSESSPLPAFSTPGLFSGQPLTNKTFKGKVSLLNVWASWCGYCQREHGMLMKVKNVYHVPIYGLAFRDDDASAKAWLKEAGNPYTAVGIDTDGSLGSTLDIYGTPQTYVIDKKGMVRYRHTGGIDETTWKSTLWPLVHQLMNEK